MTTALRSTTVTVAAIATLLLFGVGYVAASSHFGMLD